MANVRLFHGLFICTNIQGCFFICSRWAVIVSYLPSLVFLSFISIQAISALLAKLYIVSHSCFLQTQYPPWPMLAGFHPPCCVYSFYKLLLQHEKQEQTGCYIPLSACPVAHRISWTPGDRVPPAAFREGRIETTTFSLAPVSLQTSLKHLSKVTHLFACTPSLSFRLTPAVAYCCTCQKFWISKLLLLSKSRHCLSVLYKYTDTLQHHLL